MTAPDVSRAGWRKSSHSDHQGRCCVEVAFLSAADWRRSSYDGGNGHNWVEVKAIPSLIGVRDSKNVRGPVLLFAPVQFGTFRAALKAGEFSVPESR